MKLKRDNMSECVVEYGFLNYFFDQCSIIIDGRVLEAVNQIANIMSTIIEMAWFSGQSG